MNRLNFREFPRGSVAWREVAVGQFAVGKPVSLLIPMKHADSRANGDVGTMAAIAATRPISGLHTGDFRSRMHCTKFSTCWA